MNNNQITMFQNNNNNPLFQNASQNQRKNFKLTNEESVLYNNYYSQLDKQNSGKINAKEAADFMKTSNLQKSVLKTIWLIASQTDDHFLLKSEFFVACRLIALAQNNMPYTAQNIEMNNPIPPLPKFDIKIEQNQNNQIFEISDKEKNFFTKIFEQQKENNSERIKAHNAIVIWKNNNADDNAIRIVANILKPLENKGFLNLKEFIVACHLINISKNINLPQKLPDNLLQFLGRNNNFNNVNVSSASNYPIFRTDSSGTFGSDFSKINQNSSNNFSSNDDNIQKTLKRAEELNQKNENLNQQINNAKNKINVLLKEIDSLENEQEKIKNELNSIIQECKNLRNNNNNFPPSNNMNNNMSNNMNNNFNYISQSIPEKMQNMNNNTNNNMNNDMNNNMNNNNNFSLQNKKSEENINSNLEHLGNETSNAESGKIEEMDNFNFNNEDNKDGFNNNINNENDVNNNMENNEKKEEINIKESGLDKDDWDF